MTIDPHNVNDHLEEARHDHQMHHHPHGYVRSERDSRGRCGWRWDSDGCVIYCWAYDLPGTGRCAHHLAQEPQTVVFPARVVAVQDADA